MSAFIPPTQPGLSERQWVDHNMDEVRAALIAIESNVDAYTDTTIGTITDAMRTLVVASQRISSAERRLRERQLDKAAKEKDF